MREVCLTNTLEQLTRLRLEFQGVRHCSLFRHALFCSQRFGNARRVLKMLALPRKYSPCFGNAQRLCLMNGLYRQ